MPRITNITKQKRKDDRYNIYLDEEYAGSLNAETMVKFDIETNKLIELDFFNEIVETDNRSYAFNLALKYVSYRRRTEKEVFDYLVKKELTSTTAEHAVKKLLAYGYLNDLEFAKEFIAYHINAGKYGKIVLKHKMITKGFSESITDNALSEYRYEQEYKNAERIYHKILNANQKLDPRKLREKLYRSLASKGFEYDIISDLLRNGDTE